MLPKIDSALDAAQRGVGAVAPSSMAAYRMLLQCLLTDADNGYGERLSLGTRQYQTGYQSPGEYSLLLK